MAPQLYLAAILVLSDDVAKHTCCSNRPATVPRDRSANPLCRRCSIFHERVKPVIPRHRIHQSRCCPGLRILRLADVAKNSNRFRMETRHRIKEIEEAVRVLAFLVSEIDPVYAPTLYRLHRELEIARRDDPRAFARQLLNQMSSGAGKAIS